MSSSDPAVPQLERRTSDAHPRRRGSLLERTIRGSIRFGFAAALVQALGLASSVVVARHLSPTEFGTAAMAMVVVAFARVFSGFGVAPAIVSGRLSGDAAMISAHWIVCGTGLLLTVLAALSEPLVVWFFDNQAVGPVLTVAALILVLSAVEVVPLAMMQAANRFGTAGAILVVGQLVASSSAVLMAMLGAGVWALIVPRVLGTLVSAVMLWTVAPLGFRARFSLSLVRPYLREGAQVTGAGLTTYLFRSCDRLVIGRMFGQGPLGLYTFAYNLIFHTMGTLGQTIVVPLLGSLGEIRNDRQRFDHAVVRAIRTMARLVFPVAVGGAIVAPTVVPTVFGTQWTPSVFLVQIFLLIGALQTLAQLSGQVWLALGRSRLLLNWSVLANTSTVPVFILGGWLGGTQGVALAFAAYVTLLLPLMVAVTRRYCGIRFDGLAIGLSGVVRDVLVMVSALYLLRFVLGEWEPIGWWALALQVGTGVLAYVLAFRLMSSRELADLVRVLPQKTRRFIARLVALPLETQ